MNDATDDLDRLPAGAAGPAGRTRPPLALGALVAGAVAVGVAIMMAVVLIGHPKLSLVFPWQSRPRPAGAQASRQTAAGVTAASPRFDPATKRFSADGLEGTVPLGWFTGQSGHIDIGTGVGGCFGNGCRPYVAGQHPLEDDIPWGAEFEVVTVEDSLTGTDLDETADKILSYWTQYTIFYTDVSGRVSVKKDSRRTLTANLPRPARMITAELHHRNPDIEITYDHFYLLVVRGTFGQYTAFIADWSNNAPTEAKKAIQDSINTLLVT